MENISINNVIIARYAGAMYNVAAGYTTNQQVLDDVSGLGSMNAFLNQIYAADFSQWPTLAVANRIATNLGLTGALFTEASNYITAQLNATDPAQRGTLVKDLLNLFGQMVNDPNPAWAAAATKWEKQVTDSAAFSNNPNNTVGVTLPAPVVPPNAGQIFTLTTNQDSGPAFTGGTGDDTFNAGSGLAANGTTVVDALQNFDSLDGGGGKNILNATLAGASAPVAPSLKNIQTVNLRVVQAGDAMDFAGAVGVTSIIVANSTAATGTMMNVGEAGLAVMNQTSAVTFDKSTATSLKLGLDTVGTTKITTTVDLGAGTAAKAKTLDITTKDSYVDIKSTAASTAETVTIAATGANNLKLTDDALTAKTVTVTGTGSVNLSGMAFTGQLTKFDASANTGGVQADIQSSKAAAVTTGSGNDTIDMDTLVTAGTSAALGAGNDKLYAGAQLAKFDKGVDGGDGTDIINVTDGTKLDATTAKYITNFETLDVSGGKGAYDVSLNSFATVQIDEAVNGALTGAVDFTNAPDTFTLNIASKANDADFAVGFPITVVGKDYAGTTDKGTAETFTLVATLNDGDKDNNAEGNINANKITVNGVEKLVVAATTATLDGGVDALPASKSTLTVEFADDKAESLTITGDASVTLSGATTLGMLNSITASGSTGNMKINMTTHAQSIGYVGSSGVDTYTASTAGDTIYTAKAADIVTLGAVRDTFVLKLATDSQITDVSKDGKLTIGADAASFDMVTGFDTTGGAIADRLDVTNFAFTGAQRGVADVSATVNATTNMTNIADLFNTAAGDRGVAFTLIGADSYVLVDANKDGNFTAADDVIINLVGVAAVSETVINF